MSFSAADLHAALLAITPKETSGYVVALSGGADSAALLAAAVQLPGAPPLRAVHIDHGLQAAAAALRDQCRELCRRLAVPLSVIAVEVAQLPGESLEAAAREARYAALAADLKPRECLITAQHAEDQAETLLLQALRGAGLDGLSCMPPCRELGEGWQLRPLLEVTQRALLSFGVDAAAPGVADPMNQDLRFDRVYLRRRVWPLLQSRWPGAALALTRTARHLAEAQALLQQAAAADVERLRDGDALSVPTLRALSQQRRVAAVRAWLRLAGATATPA